MPLLIARTVSSGIFFTVSLVFPSQVSAMVLVLLMLTTCAGCGQQASAGLEVHNQERAHAAACTGQVVQQARWQLQRGACYQHKAHSANMCSRTYLVVL